jgi:hypothetical protein
MFPLSTTNSRVCSRPDIISVINYESGEERKQVFMWMSEIDYRSHHDDLSKNLLPGTGQWLLESADYIQWGQSSRSAILWLHGMRRLCNHQIINVMLTVTQRARAKQDWCMILPICMKRSTKVLAHTLRPDLPRSTK